MTVLVLYAGGTIGMESTKQGYQPMPNFEAFLNTQMASRTDQLIPAFNFLALDHLIDSSNLLPSDWTTIGNTLQSQWEKYDAFVLLHGTDTMAYTASMLSFMLQGCDKPVIVTGSQIPMTEVRNDAMNNFIGALIITSIPYISEICIYFNGRLIRGNRATKVSSQDLSAFDSPNYPHIANIGIKVELKQHLLLATSSYRSFEVPTFNPASVAILYIYPGMQIDSVTAVLKNDSLQGLILCTYGAGNPPSDNQQLMNTLKLATKKGVCIINVTQCLKGGVTQGAYATGSALGEAGVLSGYDLTMEAAFTKLHFLIACGLAPEQVTPNMAIALCGESTHN